MNDAKSSEDEVAANEALQDALKALVRANKLCEKAGYESMVLAPLADALRETNYAWDTALGRN